MPNFESETEEALKAGRVHFLIFFDFLFTPLRVHCGEAAVQWNGHKWTGVGDAVNANFSYSVISNSANLRRNESRHDRGQIVASLPLDNATREIIAKGYYRERKIEIFICSYDERGIVIEKVGYALGTIVKVSLTDNVITFTAKDAMFDSLDRQDERHKRMAEDYRMQFKGDLSNTVSSTAVGWTINMLWSSAINWLGFAFDLFSFFRRSNRRAVAQRWQARKRAYWFKTTPNIPWKWKWKTGYRVRADTLAEAKAKLYSEAVRKIWLFPRGWVKLLVEVNGRPLEIFDLDAVRRAVDPDRWKETDPLGAWKSNIGRSNSSGKE